MHESSCNRDDKKVEQKFEVPHVLSATPENDEVYEDKTGARVPPKAEKRKNSRSKVEQIDSQR